jgi:hypothetical protein
MLKWESHQLKFNFNLRFPRIPGAHVVGTRKVDTHAPHQLACVAPVTLARTKRPESAA